MSDFTVSSDQFLGQVPTANCFDGMGVGGQNLSPQITWKNAPAGTKSFLIYLHDPDAPTPSGFTHWCAFNIPSSVNSLATGASTQGMPAGTVQATNSYGNQRYDGAAPPPGDEAHAYLLTVYALGVEKLDLDASVPPPRVVFTAREHVLAKAGIVAYYAR